MDLNHEQFQESQKLRILQVLMLQIILKLSFKRTCVLFTEELVKLSNYCFNKILININLFYYHLSDYCRCHISIKGHKYHHFQCYTICTMTE